MLTLNGMPRKLSGTRRDEEIAKILRSRFSGYIREIKEMKEGSGFSNAIRKIEEMNEALLAKLFELGETPRENCMTLRDTDNDCEPVAVKP